MNNPTTFEEYLRGHFKKGVIDFSLRVQKADELSALFYIHAANVDSETRDYFVRGDSLYQIGETSRLARTINNTLTDRENLEWLVYFAVHGDEDEEPLISISRGRELLGFSYMDDMREWIKSFAPKFAAMNAREAGR